MRTYRNLRVAGLIQKELGEIILREMEFPDSVLATIIEVEVSKDLSQAKIKLGVIPFDAAPEVMNIIERRRPFLQNLLMKKINIKPTPRIFFEIEKQEGVVAKR